jgi:DNA polymerase-1
MIQVERRLRDEGLRSRMILQIHDELVFETPVDEAARLADLVRAEMTSAMALSVPLKVDLAAGRNWLDVEPL